MRRAILVVALAVALPCAAQRAKEHPWMTGERLLKLYSREGRDLIKEGHGRFTREELIEHHDELNEMEADLYMDGVHDATEGKAWCYSKKYDPHPDTLHGQIIWELRKLPLDQLRRNAADLIAEIWASKWPCGGGR
jgi:hypothetical protein